MKRSILLLGVLAALSAGAQESRGICGNTAADQKLFEQRLIDNLAAVEAGHVHERQIISETCRRQRERACSAESDGDRRDFSRADERRFQTDIGSDV